MNLSKTKTMNPKPPEKGSFPLDHFAECGTIVDNYMTCLKQNDSVSRYCRQLAQQYLACRMENGLMARENMENLGFKQPPTTSPAQSSLPFPAPAPSPSANQ